MVELAKLFLQHGVAVTVALVEPPLKALDFSAVVARAAASSPSIAFHVLSPPPPAPSASSSGDTHTPTNTKHHLIQMLDCLKAMNAPLRDFLRSLPAVDALVIDMFCADAFAVAADLELPVYYSYASCAGYLAVFINLASAGVMNTGSGELGDTVLSLPGAPPFKVSDLPTVIEDNREAANAIYQMLKRIPESNGILINTFEWLETRAVRALRDGVCVPERATPPVYCIGPLVSGGGESEHVCLQWLDSQPDSSVVFLCFGSMGTFSKRQLEEIAVGLEKSELRFLWVVRGADHNFGEPLPEPDLDELLPEGFVERTKDTGLVVKPWVPQVDVLRHRATGAFVTHRGWNTALEGITAGLAVALLAVCRAEDEQGVHRGLLVKFLH